MSPPERKTGPCPWREREREHASRAWGFLLFGLIGATTATAAFAFSQLRRSYDWFHTQLKRMHSSSSWRSAARNSAHGDFREEAWKRYSCRMQEEYEEEIERVQCIRRMQSVFHREREKFKRIYESWKENVPGGYQYIPRDDWYWKTETSYRDQKTNHTSTPRGSSSYPMLHHYTVLGLDRLLLEQKPWNATQIRIKTIKRPLKRNSKK